MRLKILVGVQHGLGLVLVGIGVLAATDKRKVNWQAVNSMVAAGGSLMLSGVLTSRYGQKSSTVRG